jgi:hypothetical protein
MNITHRLAEFAATTRFDALPVAVRSAAKTVIVDGIANAVAGSQEPAARKMSEYITSLGGVPDATVVGSVVRLPASQAALVNGVSLHCLDYEVQGYPSAHGSSSILPAVAAVAERENASGADVLTAFTVGWEVQQRLRAAGEKGDMRGFHPPGIVGPLGAAAAVANLLGVSADETAMALGLAASRTGGLFGNNGTMTKATHPGNAARSGVESVDLALLGMTSNPDILHARRGYVAAAMGGVFDDDLAVGDLGSRFHLEDPGFSIKPFPAEIYMQWPLDAMTTLKQREGLTLDDVVEVIVEPPVFRADLSRPLPASGLDGNLHGRGAVQPADGARALPHPPAREPRHPARQEDHLRHRLRPDEGRTRAARALRQVRGRDRTPDGTGDARRETRRLLRRGRALRIPRRGHDAHRRSGERRDVRLRHATPRRRLTCVARGGSRPSSSSSCCSICSTR